MLDEVRSIVGLLMKRPITAEVVQQVKAIEGYAHLEIVDGQWVGLDAVEDELTSGERHGWIEALLIILIGGYVLQNKLGRVYPGDVSFVLDGEPGDIRLMREPDVAFVANENVEPSEGYIYRAPDIAIEIISPSQSAVSLLKKRDEYLQHGTTQVWIVNPALQQIEVYTPDGTSTLYNTRRSIEVGDLLPGFVLNVAAVFGT